MLPPSYLSNEYEVPFSKGIKRWFVNQPDKCGSSEKDSNARPPRGLRWILQVGARSITEDLILASSPSSAPTLNNVSVSNVDAMAVAHYGCVSAALEYSS